MEKLENEKIQFNYISKEWLTFKKIQVKESTYLNYKFKIDKYLNSEFGKLPISYFNTYNINQYVDKLTHILANKSVREIICVFKAILKYAERKYDMDFKLDLISVPRLLTREVEVFDDISRNKIENYIIKSKDTRELAPLISLYSGLRIGEVCALKWSDIDFKNKTINVTHTLQRVYVGKKETRILYTVPKTKKSIRKIPMAKILYSTLRPLSKLYTKDCFVLTGSETEGIEPILYRYTYKKIINGAEVNFKNFHALRHTFATRCIQVGMDVKSLSELLGHTNSNVTLSIYVHSSSDIKKKFIDKL